MKKLLVLLIAVMGIFAFSTGAFAQLLDVCEPCDKCAPYQIPCVDPQGGICAPFDYNSDPECKAVFSVCNCLDAGTTFVTGKKFGIRMTILVDGLYGQRGAYWSAFAPQQINFSTFATQIEACAASAYNSTFGPVLFYKATSAGEKSTAVSSLASGVTCAVPSGNQATIIESDFLDPLAGYVISPAEEALKLSRWVIDIPPIRYDANVLTPGAKISVRIEIIDMTSGGICADCLCICECIIEVAEFCAQDEHASQCLFPYFTSVTAPTDTQPWWNGIAIVNTGSLAGTATLSVTQQDGAKGTFTTDIIPAGSIFVQPLSAIDFTATSGTLGDLPVWIKVTTTFQSMDGFAIIADSDTGESMGYLCRMGVSN